MVEQNNEKKPSEEGAKTEEFGGFEKNT